jgi:methylthioribose-1-phosphate isomerase
MACAKKVELPFLIRPENTARYEDGEVLILDRRAYPFEVKFVGCKTYKDVAKAIRDMVTQSGGPPFCAGYGMAQAGREARGKSSEGILEELARAAKCLIDTRPTNNSIILMTEKMLEVGRNAVRDGHDVENALVRAVNAEFTARHKRGLAIGENGASLIRDGDSILSHCWAESGIVYTAYVALQQGKRFKAYCSETRPYLQGARLTADALCDMGIETTVITDNMPAYLMSKGMISKFFTGADRVTMDGSVINKIGTLQIAVSAHQFGVPFFAFSDGPDPEALTAADVVIEERDPNEVLHCLGQRTATPLAKGYYPAFDVTPAGFISAIVTDRGVFSPYSMANYWQEAPVKGM